MRDIRSPMARIDCLIHNKCINENSSEGFRRITRFNYIKKYIIYSSTINIAPCRWEGLCTSTPRIEEYGQRKICSDIKDEYLFILKRVAVWCGFTASFIVGPFFFEEIGPAGPVTYTVKGVYYESLLCNHVIAVLQQRACVGSTIFMQDGAPHKHAFRKRLLSMHFGSDMIISRHFSTNWPPRSPDFNPCDFWLWNYLKHGVFSGLIANLTELKTRIVQHIHNLSTDTLRSVVEDAISRFELVARNVGQHIEHFLRNYRDS
ncbi:hypothetical protein AVEN_58101-1 [Araneus ventricosus]|uniref:Tc1-like transposase DDE domain-containing protein n=1 Tax=Araneus ventricosus TaxID=182803 RepID=A0A4Y2N2A0_ARAVE|nr:hypothetical protein AVEN_58101-1 [Araneus ventricosus]